MERKNIVREKAFAFAVRIVRLSQRLIREDREYVISKQIAKSGTSIGANIEEAEGAYSRRDFSAKMSISYKEARETHYWLRLLHATGLIEKAEFDSYAGECDELCRLLFSILRTSRAIRRSSSSKSQR